MHKYFKEKYGMSEIGAKHLTKSIFSHTIVNLTKIFPATIGFLFISQSLGQAFGLSKYPNLPMMYYFVMIVVMFVVMFLVARWDYVNLYENVYNESARTRVDVANRLKKLPLSYFAKRDLSDLSATIMSDIELYETIFSHSIPQLYATTISTSMIAIMLFVHNWKMAIAILGVIPVAFLLYVTSRKKQKKIFKEAMGSVREVYDDVQEKIDQIQEIKSYNLEDVFVSEFNDKVNHLSKIKIKTEFSTSLGIGISTIILKFGIVLTAIYGAHLLLQGQIDVIMYIAYLMITASVYAPIEGLLGMLTMIMMMEEVVKRIKEIKTMPIQEGKTEVVIDNYDIEFKDVVFGYQEYSVINGVSFTAKQGEITALIGPSGSGKTTLTKLAARFWDVQQGQILIGNQDISTIDPETLLKSFSIVFQDVILFNSSIKENIRVGKKGASDKEVLQAARIARCDEFFDKLPMGIDTMIGENGQRLSGGQRQRISIARAILKDAPIILLDEATASLDVENESLIQEALSELIKDKTVIVIAHRMRTIQGAHKIVVLKDGKVEAIGTNEELKETSALYRKMLNQA